MKSSAPEPSPRCMSDMQMSFMPGVRVSRRMRSIALQSAVGGMALSMIGMAFAATGHLSPVGGAISQDFPDIFGSGSQFRPPFTQGSERLVHILRQ